MAPTNRWTPEQRHALHLLVTNAELNNCDVTAIFNIMFAQELQACGLKDGIRTGSLKSQYRETRRRPDIWQAIIADPPPITHTEERWRLNQRIDDLISQTIHRPTVQHATSDNGDVNEEAGLGPSLTRDDDVGDREEEEVVAEIEDDGSAKVHVYTSGANVEVGDSIQEVLGGIDERNAGTGQIVQDAINPTAGNKEEEYMDDVQESRQTDSTGQVSEPVVVTSEGTADVLAKVKAKYFKQADATGVTQGLENVDEAEHQNNDGDLSLQQPTKSSSSTQAGTSTRMIPLRKMQMLHQRFLGFEPGSPSLADVNDVSSVTIDPASMVYYHGGQVCGVSVSGEQKMAYMVCDWTACSGCSAYINTTSPSPKNNRPLLHPTEIELRNGVYYYKPAGVSYNTQISRTYSQTVRFKDLDGEFMCDVEVCDDANCISCIEYKDNLTPTSHLGA